MNNTLNQRQSSAVYGAKANVTGLRSRASIQKHQNLKTVSSLFFTFLLLLFGSFALSAQTTHNLNNTAQGAVSLRSATAVPQEYMKEAKAARAFTINPVLQRAGNVSVGDVVNLQLFEGKSFTAKITKITTNVNGNVTLNLKLPDYPMAFGYITTNTKGKSLFSVSIPELNQKFASRGNVNSSISYLIEIDATKVERNLKDDYLEIVNEALPVTLRNGEMDGTSQAEPAPPVCTKNPALTGADPATIDIMMVYTPAAKAWADANEGGIDNTIAGAMAQTMNVVDNQGDGDAINLVHSAQIEYTEVLDDNMSTDLNRLINTDDGYMDNVHQLRKQHHADIVVLVEVYNTVGGLGMLLFNDVQGNYAGAFNTVRVQQISYTITSIHEIGHNMGMRHNSENNTGDPLYPYAFGWHWTGNDNKEYGSVMSYIGIRAPYFSNPNETYKGVATGTATANNAQVFRNTKHVVANYSNILDNLPTSPTNVQVSNPTSYGATISWDAIPDATSYRVCFYFSGNSGNWFYWPTTNNTITINYSEVFSPCNTYYFFIQAVNDCGNVSSQTMSFTTACPCNAPTSVIVPSGNITQTSAIVNWSGSANEYVVEYKESSALTWTSVSPNPTTSTVTLSSLTPNTTYNVRVKAICSASSESIYVSETFITLATPPTITSANATSVIQGTGGTFQVTASGSATITYSLSNEPTGVSINGATGLITIAGTTAAGNHTFTITASNGANPNATQSFTLTVTAVPTYTITASAGSNGAIAPSGNVSVDQGDDQTFTFTPNTGYEIDQITVNGSNITVANSYTFNNVTSNQTINVTFKAKQYTLSFDPQSGAVSPTTQTVAYDAAIGTLPTPTYSGYTFGGWFTQPNGGGTQYTASTVYQTDGPITLYAKWTTNPTYTITASAGLHGAISPSGNVSVDQGDDQTFTFTPNIGYEIDQITVNGSNITVANSYTFNNVTSNQTINVTFKALQYTLTLDDGATTANQTVTYDAQIGTLSTPTRIGYTFGGWFTQPNGAGVLYTASSVYDIAAAATFYAKWTANVYTLTFNAQGGAVNPANQTVAYDASVGTLPTPTYSGYTFGGWFTQPNGGGTLYTATTIYNETTNLTLHAKWTANAYTLTFDPQGGTVSPTSLSVTYGAQTGTLPTPTLAGYTFDGWWTGTYGSGTEYTATTVYNTAGNVTLYAKWIAAVYTLTFDPQGGTVSPTSKSVSYNAPVGTLPTPTRSGFAFNGWFTATNGSGVQYNATTVYNTTGNTTLYANWIITQTCIITATAGNNGTISPSGAIVVNIGNSQTFTFTPNSGYEVDQVLIDGVDIGASNSYTFAGVSTDQTIHVTFKVASVVPPTVTTQAATNVTQTTATLNKTVTAGTESVTDEGFEYRVSGMPNWFTATTNALTGLTANTIYEFRAFAKVASGTIYYGATLMFTTQVQATYSISATPLTSFGSKLLGYASPPSGKFVTITNNGTNPVTLNQPTATTSNYTVGAIWPTTLNPGAMVQFGVQPNVGLPVGNYPDTITVTIVESGAIATVAVDFTVSATATTIISVAPQTVAFGSLQAPYTQPAAQTVTITNIGTEIVTLNQPTANTDYIIGSLSLPSGSLYNSSATETFTVQPKANLPVGTHNATITVSGNSFLSGLPASATFNVTFTVTSASVVAPTVITQAVSNVSQTAAKINKTVTAGSETITEQGFEYRIIGAPSWTKTISAATNVTLTGLKANRTYQYRAYAKTASGTTYGSILTFKTLANTNIPVPKNDQCMTATALYCGANWNGTTDGATEKANIGYAASHYGVWYVFRGDGEKTTITSVADVGLNHKMVIYTGECNSLTYLTDKDEAGIGETESYEFNTVEGTTYYVYIAYNNASGDSLETGDFSIARTCYNYPKVTTLAATEITSSSATLNMLVTPGWETIVSTGFKYRVSASNTWHTSDDGILTGLTSDTQYEFYATIATELNRYFGATLTFTTLGDNANTLIRSDKIVVYPNPAIDRLTIEGGSSEIENAIAEIFDLFGRRVIIHKLSDGNTINVSNLPSGIYLIKIGNGVSKFIKE